MGNNIEIFHSRRERLLAAAVVAGVLFVAAYRNTTNHKASAEKAKVGITANTGNIKFPNLSPASIRAIIAKELAIVDQDNKLTPAKRTYYKAVVSDTTEVALTHKNINPAAVAGIVNLEGGWGEADSGNFGGIKCSTGDFKPNPNCSPLEWTQEDHHDGRGLQWEQHRFEIVPGKTELQKVASTVRRIDSEVETAPWFKDVKIAALEDNPAKNTRDSLNAFENWTDGHGHVIHWQGEKDANGHDLVQSYATLNQAQYIARVEAVMALGNADQVFQPYWAAVGAHS